MALIPGCYNRRIASHALHVALLVAFLNTGCRPSASTSPAASHPDQRTPAPAWALEDFEGKRVQSSDFLGKVVVLDFWATWCPPCREEIPSFVELQEKYRGQGLVIVGIDVGPESASTVQAFIKKMKINYPILAGSGTIEQAFGGVAAIPTTFLIDRQGRVAGHHVGFTSAAQFEDELKPLLAEAAGK